MKHIVFFSGGIGSYYAAKRVVCVWQYENTIFGHLKYKFPYVIASTIFT